MKFLFLVIIPIIVLVIYPVNSLKAVEQSTELIYDDGSAEAGWRGPRGSMNVVKFTPPYSPCQLISVKYFIKDEPADFKVRVLDERRNVIFETVVTCMSTGWFTVDLLEDVFIEGDFYVGMERLTSFMPVMGADVNGPDGRSFFVPSPDVWTPYSEIAGSRGQPEGDLMIRAIIVPTMAWMPQSTTETAISETGKSGIAFHQQLIKIFSNLQFLEVVIGVIALIAGGTAYMMRVRKERLVKNLFREIDDIYSRYKMNIYRCESELLRLKNRLIEEMKRGKIREESFTLLKDRINEYLDEIKKEIKSV